MEALHQTLRYLQKARLQKTATQTHRNNHGRRNIKKTWPWLIVIIQILAATSGAFTAVIQPQMFGFEYIVGEPKVALAAGIITGTVYNDYNADGTMGTYENGVAGVTVTAYDQTNTAVGSTTTIIDGTYSLVATGTGPYRIEFTNLSAGMFTGPAGTNSGTTVQFVPDGNSSGVDLGANIPLNYCQDNPEVCVPFLINGDPALGSGLLTTGIFRFNEDDRGTVASESVANRADIGSTWGIAYNRETSTLYAAAFLKRHVGMGPSGPGAIYQIADANQPTPGATSLFFDVSTVAGVDVGTIDNNTVRGLTGTAPSSANVDGTTFTQIGKVGLGDIDISDDFTTLYTVNLNERTLLEIPIANPASLVEYAIPTDACTNGEARPFATKYYQGNVYVGVICDGTSGTRADLEAIVYEFSPIAPAFTPVLTFPLDYQKGTAGTGCSNTDIISHWNPWNDTPNTQIECIAGTDAYPQPMLTDIEFDIDGSMILGFSDRWGHQAGFANHSATGILLAESAISSGDILRAYNNAGFFELESNGSAGPLVSLGGVGNNEGPGGGEFYYGDVYSTFDHEELAQGGLALRYGSGNVISTAMDPINATYSGGVRHFRNTDGFANASTGYQLFNDNGPAQAGKGNGLGDVELLCDLAPLEIGNRVWMDTDGNGIQDPDELPIPGIIVTLYSITNTVIATTTTDLNGEYYFSNDSNPAQTWATPGGRVEPNTDYQIRIDLSQSAVAYVTPTQLDYNNNVGNGDLHDSDGNPTTNPGFVTVALTTGGPGENNHTYDFGFTPLAAIGNYVWFDEDSDGEQDAGEPGIPNVRIILRDENGDPVAETYTDSNGGYLFPQLPPGTYYVDVDELTLPLGMTQSPTTNPNADFGNQDHTTNPWGYPVTVGPGEENLTADFGYNINPPTDVNNPSGSPLAALGDRIWIDSNGNGIQDPSEVGVSGVELTLYHDPDGNGVYDTPYTVGGYLPTRTTDDNGNYLFDSLPAGAYAVRVTDSSSASHDILNTTLYDQTGDPDHFAANESTAVPGTANDHLSTIPVVLAPGDVFLNVDFGYQPEPTAPVGSIGDTIWFDADADGNGPSMAPIDGGPPITQGAGGTADNNEYGIPGVTVALIRDTNQNGLYDPGTDPIIATTITDENGQYLFSGLPLDDGDGDADYLVWVNDTDNVLQGLTPTYDNDGLATPNISARAISLGDPDQRDQDFGYTPAGHSPALGLIGDTIWFDQNNSGGNQTSQGSEPGIEGVIVELLDDSGNLIATTTTNENGQYYFASLPLNQTYQVRVADENFLPGGVLEGFYNTYDPNGGNDGLGPQITLTPGSPINLDQDFSYYGSGPTGLAPVGRIGNLVWLDPDADGLYNPNGADGLPGTEDDETPIAGVTVDLYRDLNGNGVLDPGEPRIATTTTSATITPGTFGADGNYIFEGLPAGDYIVDVSDRNGVLAGYWKSDGPNNGTNNNSQIDPYALSLSEGGENLTADFGYYVKPAAVGNYVWLDTNADGIQNDGETGLNNVPVTLTITYPDGTISTLSTRTANDPVNGNPGWYSFGNLLLDEDYNGSGANPEPSFVIQVGEIPGYLPTLDNQGSDLTDSDDHDGVTAQPIQGRTNTNRTNDTDPIASYDFGFVAVVAVGDYVWYDNNGNGQQDTGEPGVPGVTATLYDTTTNEPVLVNGLPYTDITDENGLYLFTDLPPGDYYVIFDLSTLPAGYAPTTANQGSDTSDSDADATGRTDSTGFLASGGQDLTLDLGILAPVTVGDYVWYDNNGNGQQDTGEPGVPGIVVTIYDATTNEPVIRSGVPYTDVTDSNGLYLFTDLPPGDYYVIFDLSTLPAGYAPTTANQGADTSDSDADATGRTPSTGFLSSGQQNLTLDLGILAPVTVGDYVWYDNNENGQQDTGESGVSGVRVTIYDATTNEPVLRNGVPLTTVTDGNGLYLFTDLPPGDYYVIFDLSTLPAGYEPTAPNQGADTSDSDADATGRTPSTGYLSSGQEDRTLDLGILRPQATAEEPGAQPTGPSTIFLPQVGN